MPEEPAHPAKHGPIDGGECTAEERPLALHVSVTLQ